MQYYPFYGCIKLYYELWESLTRTEVSDWEIFTEYRQKLVVFHVCVSSVAKVGAGAPMVVVLRTATRWSPCLKQLRNQCKDFT